MKLKSKILIKTLIFFFILLSLLLGCEDKEELTYVKGFSQEESPALTDFMKNLITGNDEKELLNQDGHIVYPIENVVPGSTSFTYFHFKEGQLNTYHQQLLQAENPSSTWNELFNSEETATLREPLGDINQYALPTITISDDYQLKIQTESNQIMIDLIKEMEQFNISYANEFIINIVGITDNTIALEIDDTTKDEEFYYLFINQDLSDFTIIQLNQEGLEKAINNGTLNNYFDVFPGEDDYRSTFNKIAIFNVDTKEVVSVAESDLISKDGKFVYLNGYTNGFVDITDGKQRIQTIENYAKGSETYKNEFTIDFDTISKELDFETKKVKQATIVYFNKDYVVLRLRYHGKIIGQGGATNVLIDLQDKENPTAYLVDLGLR